MKILVMGKQGQLAQALQKQRDVKAISSQEINLADVTPLLDMDFDVLINAAAYNWTEKAIDEPDMAFDLNGYAVGRLAQAAKSKGALFVHVGSDFVFSGTKNKPYNESDPAAPLSIYGSSKALGEHLALQYGRSYVFRTASLYSEGGNNFPNTIIKRAREGKELKVIDDIVMSPTNADDLAKMILRSLDCQIPFGLYHAVNKGSASWHQFAKLVLQAKGIDHPVKACSYREFPSRILRPLYSVLDVSKLEREIGEVPSWEKSLVS